jgi:TPR repeat protein
MKPVLLAFAALLLAAAPAKVPLDRALLAGQLAALSESGNAEAAYHLGMMKHLGLGGPKDDKAAFELFKKAADAGDPLAAFKLGDYYGKADNGQVEPDKAEALRLKTIAAEAGYALAQYDVARLHFEADQTDLALEWLLRAAQQGHPDALRALASLYNSEAVPKDAARTYAYYTLYLARLAAPTEKQRAFLTDFVAQMSDDDKTRGNHIVKDWDIETSPLTAKAQSGLRAAEALVAASVR